MTNEKISLCAITGNCEGIIGRFLEGFKPVADEIVIVRAIGNQKHDDSLSIALNAGCTVGSYFNEKGHRITESIDPTTGETHTVEIDSSSWPHVDSFSAARNFAWSMASHEWVMWADIDDLIDEASIKEFRRLVAALPRDVNMIQCPYVVPDQNIHRNMRERIVRRGQFKWVQPVHEFLVPLDGVQARAFQTQKARIVHGAKNNRLESSMRNLRILEAVPLEQRGAPEHFYMFSEYYGVGKKEEAVEAAKKFLDHKDAGETEKYEVYLQLSRMTEDPSQKEQLLCEAHRVSPYRCEALYELANLSLTFGSVDRAKAYVRQMRALPIPDGIRWNIREGFYGWDGQQLESQVIRCDGQEAKANALDFNAWKAAGGKISLLHATRGRPLQAHNARLTWLDKAANPAGVEHIFAIDADDDHSQVLRRFRHVIVSGKRGCVEAWNVSAYASHGEVLIQMSDDWMPPDNWDEIILQRLGDLSEPKVLAISDGHRKDGLLCMAILTRARWEKQDKCLFHPDFTGVYSDTWFSRCAYKDGVVIDARDVVFEHLHPFFGTAGPDDTYATQNSQERYVEGERLFRQLEAAEGRTIHTHCSVRLGDNLAHLQFLRSLARRYPHTTFVHAAFHDYLPQMRDVVCDLPNITLAEEVKDGSIEVWKGHEGYWYSHPDRNDYCKFYVQWFDIQAKQMGLENPIKTPDQFQFDYPALLQKTPMDGPFDVLVVNSPPMSGQLKYYSDLSATVLALKENGYKVITTRPVLGVECTQDYKLNVSAIGSLSRQCRFIIMVSTGPSWPTFNIFNRDTVELRIILIDHERIHIAPNTIHVPNEASVLTILKEKKVL